MTEWATGAVIAAIGAAVGGVIGAVAKWQLDLRKEHHRRASQIEKTAVLAYQEINESLQRQIDRLVERVQTVEKAESECRQNYAALHANYLHLKAEMVDLQSRLAAVQNT
jgi:predicted  nucleic acid-binding Zn-ribbon protein